MKFVSLETQENISKFIKPGYKSQSVFSDAFKRQTGMTNLELKRKVQNEDNDLTDIKKSLFIRIWGNITWEEIRKK
jgi:AraC-like DNA-binding protein